MISVGIVGGTGYTGVELLRLLGQHPDVELAMITSRAEAGVPVSDVFPSLRGTIDLSFAQPEPAALASCDLVFFATPHGAAMAMAPVLLDKGVRIVDLSADFRLPDPVEWAHWYGQTHTCPERLDQAVYGLPEFHRERIRSAQLVANPGCYPTAVQLGFWPLVKSGVVDPGRLVANAVSGVSGAGRGAKVSSLYCEVSDSLKAYAAGGHRHLPEIRTQLAAASGKPVELTFVPHLAPMNRGIHATLYAELVAGEAVDLQAMYETCYQDEAFVDVLPAGSHPATREVRGANTCRIAIHQPQDRDTVVVFSVIDNLVKGAAGQAVQNMNIMYGFPETRGLAVVGVLP
ncbi:MAG: N-acetyl-gamma-glutamyl-phosphate reductase [Pseudomonadota bacterium]|nr:N-acetyl-gamma-glutamyl-phosphate reductase [Pseudomonadota bacterium]